MCAKVSSRFICFMGHAVIDVCSSSSHDHTTILCIFSYYFKLFVIFAAFVAITITITIVINIRVTMVIDKTKNIILHFYHHITM